MMNKPLITLSFHELVELLEGEYYSIGIKSGHEALANLLDDLSSHRLDDTLIEWGMEPTPDFYARILWNVGRSLMSAGKMWQSVEDYHKWQAHLR